jgi:hypothetical protein
MAQVTQRCAIVLVAGLLLLATAQESIPCTSNPRMVFRFDASKPGNSAPTAGGPPSYIESESARVNFAVGVTFEPFFIDVTDIPDGTVVTANVEPDPRLLTGAAVEVIAGQAMFDSFSIANSLPINKTNGNYADAWINFTATTTELGKFTLRTGLLRQLSETSASLPNYARLMHYGFLRDRCPADLPDSAPMGDFYVGIFDSLGRVVQVDATVQVACNATMGTLSPSPGPPTYSGRGIIAISSLTYHPIDTDQVTFTFTVNVAGSSFSFDSVPLTPRATGMSNDLMEFDTDTSFIREDNVGSTAVLEVKLPKIVIQLQTSTREVDTSNTGLVVIASTSQGAIEGNMALVVRGVATFSDLVFKGLIAPRAAIITFRLLVGCCRELTLRSGTIDVASTVIRSKHFKFAPWSSINERAPTRAFIDSGFINLPSFIVRVVDSAFKLDHDAASIPVAIITDPPGLLEPVGGNTTIVSNGAAVFLKPQFRLTELGQAVRDLKVRFKVKDISPGIDGARGELSTAVVTIDRQPTTRMPGQTYAAFSLCTVACEFSLAFVDDDTSLATALFEDGGDLAATVGNPIPTIRIRLLDHYGRIDSPTPEFLEDAPILVAHTSVDVRSEEPYLDTAGSANTATLDYQGTYVFACLTLKTTPSGLVRLRFTAMDRHVRLSLGALTARSGFLRVASLPTSYYSLQFGVTPPAGYPMSPSPTIIRPLQRSTAVVKVALPPIFVEVADSLGVLDSGRDTLPLSIVASVAGATSQLLDAEGTTVAVRNGIAVFDQLRFLSAVDDAVLVFTAVATGSESFDVTSDSLRTGFFKITSAPQLVSHMELGTAQSLPDTAEEPVRPYEELTFANVTEVDVYVTLRFRDSAQRPITAMSHNSPGSPHYRVLDGLRVRSVSAELDIDSTRLVNRSCACVTFWHRPSGWRNGAQGAPAYIVHVVDAVGPSGDPTMIGQRIVVGPIIISSATSTSACTDSATSATVLAEYDSSLGAFDPAIAAEQLGLVMAVEARRISYRTSAAVTISRKDHDTLADWTGIKVPVTFADPQPSDRNRKPSATLASDLVRMNGECVAPELRLRTSYYPQADQSCVLAEFDRDAASARSCMYKGDFSPCECYATILMNSSGPRCVVEAVDQLQTICVELTQCSDAQISAVCDSVPAKVRNLTGFYVTAGAFVCTVLAALVYYRRRWARSHTETRSLGD